MRCRGKVGCRLSGLLRSHRCRCCCGLLKTRGLLCRNKSVNSETAQVGVPTSLELARFGREMHVDLCADRYSFYHGSPVLAEHCESHHFWELFLCFNHKTSSNPCAPCTFATLLGQNLHQFSYYLHFSLNIMFFNKLRLSYIHQNFPQRYNIFSKKQGIICYFEEKNLDF